jgi:hypothetical protein
VARSGIAHLLDSPIDDPLRLTIILPISQVFAVVLKPVRMLSAKFLEAQRPILCDMLPLPLLEAGEALVLDPISETEKLYRRFDAIMTGLTGRGETEISHLLIEIHFPHVMLDHSTLETDLCPRAAQEENRKRFRRRRRGRQTLRRCGMVLVVGVHLCVLEAEQTGIGAEVALS